MDATETIYSNSTDESFICMLWVYKLYWHNPDCKNVWMIPLLQPGEKERKRSLDEWYMAACNKLK